MGHPDEMDRSWHHEDRVDDTSASPVGAVVVVGIDGSGTSWDALCWACGETKRLGGRTVAVFVGQTSAAASATAAASLTGTAAIYGAMQQTITDQAEELCERVRGYACDYGVDLAFVHTHGDPVTELLRIAGSDHADLIVVGRSCKARHHLAGSLGRRLVGRRNSPVIVVVP
jgi:nucleotide-binding universal stress UspA family protein